MGPPRRHLQAAAEGTCSPPATLDEGFAIAQVNKAEGNNLYSVKLPEVEETVLVELPARFRSAIWIKRGSFVVIDRSAFQGRANKLGGEIVNIVRDERQWRKQSYWPHQFSKKPSIVNSDDEDSNVGKLPPSEDSDPDVDP